MMYNDYVKYFAYVTEIIIIHYRNLLFKLAVITVKIRER
jgi:hypothetical protein